MKTIRLLILEDDIETVSVLLRHLVDLEKEPALKKRAGIAVTVYSYH